MNGQLPFDTRIYETLSVPALICEPVSRPGGAGDLRIVYANRVFSENWYGRGRTADFTGACLYGDHVVDGDTVARLIACREAPRPVTAFLLRANLHVRFEPVALPEPGYLGFLVIHLSVEEEKDARVRFLHHFRQLAGSAILVRAHEDGRYEVLYVSQEYAAMMEDTEEGTLRLMDGPACRETTHPDDRSLVDYMLANHQAPDGGPNIQIRKITAKGHTIWCSVHFAFIEHLDERYIYITYFDITVLKGYEERLRVSYDSIRASFFQEDEKTLAMFRVDLDRDEIEEARGRDLFPEDTEQKRYTAMLAARAARYPIDAERRQLPALFSPDTLASAYMEGQDQRRHIFFTIRRDGQICFAELSAKTIRHPFTGHITAFLTERECNDDKVNQTILHRILAHQFDMIAYLANRRYSVSVGDAALIEKGSIFPKTRSGSYVEYLETQVYPVLSGSEEEKAAMRESLSPARLEREFAGRSRYETSIACDIDGETFYKRFVFYSVDPEAKFYILLKQDTTDARREQIAQNEKLKEALVQAAQANAAKTTFLSNMSHDIRTPMNAIIGFTGFARRSGDLDQIHDYLTKIEASSEHLLALINDVLEMSRIESGKMELETDEADICETVDEVRDLFATQMQTKHIRYAVDTSRVTDRYVLCDRNRLNRVLLNLLSNAYKFTPENGSVSVTLRQTDGAPAGFGAYELRVKDDGIGMTPEFAAKIFEAYERERNATVNSIQGTGLGMAITKNIIDLMGGTIELHTAPGQGTEFIIRIQCELREPPAAAAQAAAAREEGAPEDGAALDFSRVRLLLVEDNEINREIAGMVLSEAGFRLEEAVNGQEAVEKVAASEPGYYDAVLMDIQMPVMNGYEATREIRALGHPALAEIPIIAMTANAFTEDIQAAREAGMNGHIAKPIDVAKMMETLAGILR